MAKKPNAVRRRPPGRHTELHYKTTIDGLMEVIAMQARAYRALSTERRRFKAGDMLPSRSPAAEVNGLAG